DLWLIHRQILEAYALIPDLHRQRLHYFVGLFPARTLPSKCEQQITARGETAERLEVGSHSRRIYLQTVDQPFGFTYQVVDEDARIGNDHPLDRRVGNITFVP